MALSPKVSRTSLPGEYAGKTNKRKSKGAFGGMNVTEAGRIEFRREKSRTKHKWEKQAGQATRKPETSRRSSTQPYKALKMQRALSAVPYERRGEIKDSIAETSSFSDFPLLPIIEQSIAPQALHGLTNIPPTPIQRLAIPALLGEPGGKRVKARRASETGSGAGMQEFLLAAETGSGKTLAYLLPVIDAMKRAEASEKILKDVEADQDRKRQRDNLFELKPPPLSNQPDPTTGRPRAIILVPSAELVEQVGALAKSLSHTIKFRAALLSAKYSGEVIRSRLFSPSGVDLVICTPHLLSSIVESNPDILSKTKHLIVDEADSLFDRSFAPLTGSILDRARPSLEQLILCSATIPRSLDTFLHKKFPEMTRLTTPKLHSIPRRVRLNVVDVSTNERYKSNKKLACADTIYSISREGPEADDLQAMASAAMKYVIVFVNERETTDEVATYLRSKGIQATPLNRDSSDRDIADTLATFTAKAPEEVKQSISSPRDAFSREETRMTAPNVRVLVTTDLASRGIDTTNVKNVILFDVPHTSIDFIHRLGRMGRMGQRGGRGYVIVGKDDRRDIVSEIRAGMFAGRALI